MKVQVAPGIVFAIYALLMPLALGVLALWEKLRTLPDAANWVQAIGSVVAIAAGFGGILLQAHLSKAAALDAEAERLARINEIVRLVFELSTRAMMLANRPLSELVQLGYEGRELKRLQAALESVPLVSLPSATSISVYVGLCERVDRLAEHLAQGVVLMDKGTPPHNAFNRGLVKRDAHEMQRWAVRYISVATDPHSPFRWSMPD